MGLAGKRGVEAWSPGRLVVCTVYGAQVAGDGGKERITLVFHSNSEVGWMSECLQTTE